MLPAIYISTSSQDSQFCIDSFTGSLSGGVGSLIWREMCSLAGKPERSEVSAAMYPQQSGGNLRPEINHKDNQGGAHSV